MNYKLIYRILFLVLILKSVTTTAQDSSLVENTDQKSYRLYTEKKWTELIKFGKSAIKKGDDYFYLRMRIGIAYYEKKNFSLAENEFKKALSFNSTDELALEYLYYCYVFNGKTEDARLLSKTFSNELLQKIGIDKQSKVDFVIIEGGTKITDSTSYYDASKKKESNYFDPATYFHVGLNHSIKNRVSLFHALSYYKQQNFVNKINQTQYYLKASIPIKNNWLIMPALHLVHIKTTSVFTSTTVPPMGPFPGPPPKQQTITSISKSNYIVGSIVAQKNINKFTLGIGTTVSNMNNVTQYIHSGYAHYSIFGNSKLVLGCTDYIHTTNNYSTINNSLAPFIYIQPLKKLSLKASYLINSGNNIIEENGYIVNNSADLTKSRWGILANFSLTKHLSVYGLYQLENKQENVQLFNYKYNVIIGGIKITP